MRALLFSLLLSISLPVTAAVWRDPATGIWVGNICQTALGWEMIPPQPVGTTCWSPGWRSYGFIANH